MSKKILCLDFDGVCHSYISGWKGADVIPDPPVEGLFEFLMDAQIEFDICIFSSRSLQIGGINAMMGWFLEHYYRFSPGVGICLTLSPNLPSEDPTKVEDPSMELALWFPPEKPPAHVSIDDRAITFDGTWPDLNVLKEFTPWNKKRG